MNTESIIRPATQAYRFYEGDPQRLREEVSHFLDRHQAGDSDQDVAALIVPHAGYYYSGNVAAKAFKQLNPERKYKRIFLLGPSHHAWLDGASVDGEADFYATPLGNVPVDKETAQALIATVWRCNCPSCSSSWVRCRPSCRSSSPPTTSVG